ncbi:MAG: uracil phosphoribosyltransferase [Thermoflexales bacterium]|nr:uracil phosphoribosyltransferase [Thermoflexales bacterium]MCS7324764.1 uracil phosphoribosyltransferase [Thermoflexales bacterium]MCX7939352.1 uracil phosphoribosyltransferase [Thermoflexales bacterium]MDW8053088.1 uracil phosphoribosyltransferase [Anaerolineae bacterium]MDW8291741.1 uracil phosphoribosyltransferase [Anaerolineae bacterium]
MVPQLHICNHPLAQHKLTILRNQNTEPKKFREVVRELAAMLIVEATADLPTIDVPITTPIGEAVGKKLADNIGLIPILRAGLGMVEGALEMLPQAEVWHIGLYRDERTLRPVEYYNKLPVHPTVQVCLVLDPMLATGGSATATVDILKRWGAQRIKFVGLIGAPEGVRRLSEAHPDVPIYLAALDERLNDKGYIVPGLGDAGDRQFGTG